jgi:hypothetical protein
LAVMNLQNKEENSIRKDDPTQFFRWNSRAWCHGEISIFLPVWQRCNDIFQNVVLLLDCCCLHGQLVLKKQCSNFNIAEVLKWLGIFYMILSNAGGRNIGHASQYSFNLPAHILFSYGTFIYLLISILKPRLNENVTQCYRGHYEL